MAAGDVRSEAVAAHHVAAGPTLGRVSAVAEVGDRFGHAVEQVGGQFAGCENEIGTEVDFLDLAGFDVGEQRRVMRLHVGHAVEGCAAVQLGRRAYRSLGRAVSVVGGTT
jgi:hypothetical protein